MNYSYLTNMNYNAGIYIRLSQEDKDKKYESDSESVTNQKEILRDYCLKNGFNLIDEYVDDGYSGTNFDRPGFIRMIEDMNKKCEKVDKKLEALEAKIDERNRIISILVIPGIIACINAIVTLFG